LITPSPNPAGILGDLRQLHLESEWCLLYRSFCDSNGTASDPGWLNDLIDTTIKLVAIFTSGGMTQNHTHSETYRDHKQGLMPPEGVQGRWAASCLKKDTFTDKSVDGII